MRGQGSSSSFSEEKETEDCAAFLSLSFFLSLRSSLPLLSFFPPTAHATHLLCSGKSIVVCVSTVLYFLFRPISCVPFASPPMTHCAVRGSTANDCQPPHPQCWLLDSIGEVGLRGQVSVVVLPVKIATVQDGDWPVLLWKGWPPLASRSVLGRHEQWGFWLLGPCHVSHCQRQFLDMVAPVSNHDHQRLLLTHTHSGNILR